MRPLTRACTCALLTCTALLAGCSTYTIRETEPPRTAAEQFLMSHAVIQSAKAITLQSVKERKVWLETKFFKSFDKEFVLGEVRSRLLALGAVLTEKRTEADIVVELRSAGVGIERSSWLLGLPSMPVPLPGVGTFKFPEIALVKNITHIGVAELFLTAYSAKTGLLIERSESLMGRTKKSDWSFVGIPYTSRENLPEELP